MIKIYRMSIGKYVPINLQKKNTTIYLTLFRIFDFIFEQITDKAIRNICLELLKISFVYLNFHTIVRNPCGKGCVILPNVIRK